MLFGRPTVSARTGEPCDRTEARPRLLKAQATRYSFPKDPDAWIRDKMIPLVVPGEDT
jgi:hypothetical protein